MFQISMRSCRNERIEKRLWSRSDCTDAATGAYAAPATANSAQREAAATRATRIATEAMNEQRNIDWTVVFATAARAGPQELVRALTTAMKTECAALAEKYDALLTHQRAAARATCSEIIAQQQAEFEQRYATVKHELLAKIENELGPVITTLRRELAAANAELARLRAAQPT